MRRFVVVDGEGREQTQEGSPYSITLSARFIPSTADMPRPRSHVDFGPEAVMEAYSITSVAKPKTDVGISMPSIFAVFKFTTNSNLLD